MSHLSDLYNFEQNLRQTADTTKKLIFITLSITMRKAAVAAAVSLHVEVFVKKQ